MAPGAALWALLPLVASKLLGLDASGYGLLLGALGLGAIAGAALLPSIGKWLSQPSSRQRHRLRRGGCNVRLVRDVAVLPPFWCPRGSPGSPSSPP